MKQPQIKQEILRTLEPNSALMTRPDLQTAIPFRDASFPTQPIGTEFITSPTDSLIQPLQILLAPTMLHKDFTHYVDEAVRILGLLREYQLTPTALSETSGFPEELITYLKHSWPIATSKRRKLENVHSVELSSRLLTREKLPSMSTLNSSYHQLLKAPHKRKIWLQHSSTTSYAKIGKLQLRVP